MRTNTAKAKLKAGEPTVGTWLSLASPMAARFLARLGFDWITVDIEHSPVNWETAADMFGAVADAGSVPLARVPASEHHLIKRALDSGAYGIVVPMVMDRAEALRSVSAMKYPPEGDRSVGGSLHALNFGAAPKEYYERANDEILVVLQCEHISAVRTARDIFSVPGIDAIFVGPNDLRRTMRTKEREATDEEFEAALTEIREACHDCGVAAGLHTFKSTDCQRRIDEGWRFLALGSDLSMMMKSATSELGALGRSPTGAVANY